MEPVQTYRPLSLVEAEMQKALEEYAEAEAKLRQSQALVHDAVQKLESARSKHESNRRQYDASLNQLNIYQTEMEVSFAALQESSPGASMWQQKEKIAERSNILGITSGQDGQITEEAGFILADQECINIILT